MTNTINKVLVTGGAGFLGPHLIRQLLEGHCVVACIDNFSNGKRSHIAPFQKEQAFSCFEGDIRDRRFVNDTLASFRPDIVYHLAAIHFIPHCVAHPAETIDVNVLGTQRILDALQHSPTARFVLASTADVYLPSDGPHREDSPLGSSNIYGISKTVCERLLDLARHRSPNTRFLSARFFNLYGPGETNPHVLPDILSELRKGRVLRLGNLEPKRDYIFAGDVAAALLRMADYAGKHEVFNIGSGHGRSVRDLLSVLEQVTGSSLRIETDPAKLRPVERQNLIADITLARRELNWSPTVELAEGLKLTLQQEAVGGLH